MENISKAFQIGKIGTGSFRRDLAYTWYSLRGKTLPDYFRQPGADHISKNGVLWALDDVSFEVQRGESLGIIGNNGAGKSTLLKILSRIIKPTSGTVYGRGRVSSLLEIGTGFHQELSGKENVFLSGYMLGMTKAEIQRKYDEIVDFAGISEFIDTPVKRYSSGMYVRLAFAVAAHLEPDILIVDEVLAVGDADFQKKSMGKMRDVTAERSRTILFVSHNMHAVTSLCDKAIWLKEGKVMQTGASQKVVNDYMGTFQINLWHKSWTMLDAPGENGIQVLSTVLKPMGDGEITTLYTHTGITISYTIYNHNHNLKLVSEVLLFNASGECIFVVSHDPVDCQPGRYSGSVTIPPNFLNDGSYYVSFCFFSHPRNRLLYFSESLYFMVEEPQVRKDWYVKWWGSVRPNFPVIVKQLD